MTRATNDMAYVLRLHASARLTRFKILGVVAESPLLSMQPSFDVITQTVALAHQLASRFFFSSISLGFLSLAPSPSLSLFFLSLVALSALSLSLSLAVAFSRLFSTCIRVSRALGIPSVSLYLYRAFSSVFHRFLLRQPAHSSCVAANGYVSHL